MGYERVRRILLPIFMGMPALAQAGALRDEVDNSSAQDFVSNRQKATTIFEVLVTLAAAVHFKQQLHEPLTNPNEVPVYEPYTNGDRAGWRRRAQEEIDLDIARAKRFQLEVDAIQDALVMGDEEAARTLLSRHYFAAFDIRTYLKDIREAQLAGTITVEETVALHTLIKRHVWGGRIFHLAGLYCLVDETFRIIDIVDHRNPGFFRPFAA